jgi:hypothetical protein
MALAYGYETAARDNPMVRTVMSLVNLLAKALSPERGVILSAFPFHMSYRVAFCRLCFTSASSQEAPRVVSRNWVMAGCCLREEARSSSSRCPV